MKNVPGPTVEQHEVHLPAGPGQLQRGMAEREPAADADSGRTAAINARPAPQSAAASGDEADGDDGADAHRPRLPHGERDQAAADRGHHHPAAASRGRRAGGLVAQQPRRLHVPHVEQRHEREQQRHQQPGADALRQRRRRQACSR